MINDVFGVVRDHANKIRTASNLEIDREEYVIPTATQERNEIKDYYELAREEQSFI